MTNSCLLKPVPTFIVVLIGVCCLMIERQVRADESGAIPANAQPADRSDSPHSQPARPSIPMKIRRYCRWLMSKYDLNRDGVLQENEWQSLQGQPQRIDSNTDGMIDLDELTRWTAEYGAKREIGVSHELPAPSLIAKDAAIVGEETSEPDLNPSTPTGGRRRDSKFYVPEKRLPAGLPDWFLSRDHDGDAQLTLAEFSPTGLASDAVEFARYDVNRDGVITARECVGRGSEKSAKSSAETSVGDPSPTVPTTPRRKIAKKTK